MIKITSDWSEIDAELDRLLGMPDLKTRMLLDAVLDAAFILTQSSVHVLTGSLKLSGKHFSEASMIDAEWEGTIRYGGPSTGVHNPVNYAIYEKARHPDEHGVHDFFAGLVTLEGLWVAAIMGGLKG